MEIYRTTSLHKIDIFNFFINSFFILINSIIGIYSIDFLIDQTRKFLEYLMEKNLLKKGSFFLNLISDIIFILITLIELLAISYIMRIISFFIIREKLFDFVVFNFKTLSNTKDIKSFTELNCIESKIDNLNDIIKGNSNFLLDLNFFMCSFEFLDKFYLEYLLYAVICLCIFQENFLVYKNIRNGINLYSFYKQILYIFIFIQISYFLFSFTWLYSIKISKNNIKLYDYDNHILNDNSYNNFDNIIINEEKNIDIDNKNYLNLNFFNVNLFDEYNNPDFNTDTNKKNDNIEDYNSQKEKKEKKKYQGTLIHEQIGDVGSQIFGFIGDLLEVIFEIMDLIS